MGILTRIHPHCLALLKNKCCICCLVFLLLLGVTVIGGKLYINSILFESEEESIESHFHGPLISSNGTFEEHPLEAWQAPEDIRKETSYILSGYDYFNRPVWILPFGKWNVKHLLNTNEDNEKYLKMNTEQFMYRIRKSMALKNVTEWVLISDMSEYSYSQLMSFSTIKFLLQMAKKFEPVLENMAYGFTLNMDYVSEKFASLIMGTFVERVETFGEEPEKYIPEILKRIPANQLPENYGGARNYQPVAIY